MSDFNTAIIDEFRHNEGRVGGMFEGSTLVLITTTGARSGRPHTVPLGYLEIDGRAVVIGSAGGGPRHPAWYHNIRQDPAVTVEIKTETYEATAEILSGAERDEMFAKVSAIEPGYGEYQKGTTRRIPVVVLHRRS
ncbi:nitroreductase family deazaflavin-dependent oxidoreductase [Paractinoplanes rishiriensis]|uniref:Nitroreductase family deazaflavin-dependent oxidoreductase n=1 Tax=Paractinoplanes rishiriensis TaxID=1050105 RepID=A0A919KBP4_9ACTN|nr:nitroreductase family deazaflavin-dependent oxidoreductase [Actinoplanes rishiriensis]GIF00422.1 hypothetical protein Ari01nite_78860 [Actinoplanes rishiriensis]